MKGRIEITFQNAAEIREYAKLKKYRTVQEYIVHAVNHNMRQYKVKPEEATEDMIRRIVLEVLAEKLD